MIFSNSTLGDFRAGRTSTFGATRILTVIAIAGAITLAGCSDSTAPGKGVTTAPSTPTTPTVSALVALAAELHDAADIFVQAVEDETIRTKMSVAINDLGTQLLAGNADGSRVALATARALFANLDDISAVELAPVGLALDYIERKLNEFAPLPV
jgi:ABC-type glycerol-3-phosphate transport system substrate-binding protein